MPSDGLAGLTEECFQKTPLDFVGEEQWVVYAKDLHSGKRTEILANRTSTGTFPPGSMWTANPLRPHMEEGGSNELGHGQIIDSIKVDTAAVGKILHSKHQTRCLLTLSPGSTSLASVGTQSALPRFS